MSGDLGYLPRLESRKEFVDYLEGYLVSGVTDLEQPDRDRKLVKTYMLETACCNRRMPDLASRFADHVRLHRLDDTLFRVEDANHNGEVVGLIEELNSRHPVLYTKMAVEHSERWVRQVVDRSPWLDRLWLSSPILFQLWKQVQATASPHRYARLGFEHEARYEPTGVEPFEGWDEGWDPADDDVNTDDVDSDSYTLRTFHERRRSVIAFTERVAVLTEKLQKLMDCYDPLRSLVNLQIPAADRGGHRFYYNGRVVNRSDSFADHRATVQRVLTLYRNVTESAEEKLWVDTTDVGAGGCRMSGSPLTIEFGQPLSEPVFNRFVELAFQRRNSRFRIGGFVTKRGATKVHIVAVDRHLWQPFLLEVTNSHLLAVLPYGICGNTVHRLVTNVQRYLNPVVKVWLGSEPYENAIADAALTLA